MYQTTEQKAIETNNNVVGKRTYDGMNNNNKEHSNNTTEERDNKRRNVQVEDENKENVHRNQPQQLNLFNEKKEEEDDDKTEDVMVEIINYENRKRILVSKKSFEYKMYVAEESRKTFIDELWRQQLCL